MKESLYALITISDLKKYLPVTCGLIFLYFLIFAQLKAGFSATPVSGCAAPVINFTDQSTSSSTTWKWELGNGATSVQQNPSTTYFAPGLYTVKLVIVNASGKCSFDAGTIKFWDSTFTSDPCWFILV
ncbi:MAG: PKD domain-containing protein [Sphingobacteriales bacterium]